MCGTTEVGALEPQVQLSGDGNQTNPQLGVNNLNVNTVNRAEINVWLPRVSLLYSWPSQCFFCFTRQISRQIRMTEDRLPSLALQCKDGIQFFFLFDFL